MKFRQFEHLGQEEGEYFSRLAEIVQTHTGLDGDAAAQLGESIWEHGILNGFRVFDRTRDVDALYKLDRAIAEIQRIAQGCLTEPAIRRLFMEFSWGTYSREADKGPIEPNSDMAKEVIRYIHGDGALDNSALSDIEERAASIRAAIKRTISYIENSRQAKVSAAKINEEGISLVDASRFIWKLATNNDAPERDLNPASPFGRFLADLFQACDNPGDPRAAFRAWVRECGEWSLDQPK